MIKEIIDRYNLPVTGFIQVGVKDANQIKDYDKIDSVTCASFFEKSQSKFDEVHDIASMLWLLVRGASTELNFDNDTLDQYDCYNANFLIIECSPLGILKGSEKTLKQVQFIHCESNDDVDEFLADYDFERVEEKLYFKMA